MLNFMVIWTIWTKWTIKAIHMVQEVQMEDGWNKNTIRTVKTAVPSFQGLFEVCLLGLFFA